MSEPVPSAELEDAKHYLTGSMPLQLETNDGVASLLVDIEWHRLGLDYLSRYIGIINGLTSEQVQAAAQRYLEYDQGTCWRSQGPDGWQVAYGKLQICKWALATGVEASAGRT